MPPITPGRDAALPRVITYYQTHHTRDGKPISILPILTKPGISVTHVILAALHINQDPSQIRLNDHHPSHPRFATLWAELAALQAGGVKVTVMLGGAARGSYSRLDRDEATFERYWAPVRDMIRERALDGIDLDVEEPMSIDGMVRLVDRVRADFGRDFVVSLAPVAAAMVDPTKNLSGFDYMELELRRGAQIDFYNTQFYNGWGDLGGPGGKPLLYDMMMRVGWPPRKIVVGLVTNPENGRGWVSWEAISSVLFLLRRRYGEFGGVMGWEYFNGLPAGRARPWEWARRMTAMLRSEHVAGTAAGAASAAAAAAPSAATSAAAPVPGKKAEGSTLASAKADADADGAADSNASAAPVPDPFEYYSDGPS